MSVIAIHVSCVQMSTHTLSIKNDSEQKKIYQVVIVVGSHLFPFRTEKLSPLTPMVLQCNAGE